MTIRVLAALLAAAIPAAAFAQSPKGATYITDEQVKAINAGPADNGDVHLFLREPTVVLLSVTLTRS